MKQKAVSLLLVIDKAASQRESWKEKLRRCLIDFNSQHFPIKSAELKEGTVQLNEYKGTFIILLKVLEERASPMIFYLILSIATREEEHVCETEMQECVLMMMSKNATDTTNETLDVAWKYLMKKMASMQVPSS